ncbi:MAG: class I SAM-dependent methyltransferase [Bryobacteraceae bacterium]
MIRRDFLYSLPLACLPGAAISGAQYEESRGEVPWVPTPEEVVETMLEMARVGPGDVVYDLGCGDGRIVIAAARKYGARGVGVDIEPERIREANEAARAAGVAGRVRFVEQDFFKTDVSEATVVALYLFSKINERLKPRLLRELKAGSRVVLYQFNGMGDWKPKRVIRKHHYPVYLFEVPPRA